MPKIAAVIVAAGRGARLGDAAGPKQYRMLGGDTVLQRAVRCFTAHPAVDRVQVVIHPDDAGLYAKSVAPHKKLLEPVSGGATRQQSCHAGIEAVAKTKCTRVLIHDAARPFVPALVIDNVVKAIAPGRCVLPACAVADTVKRVAANGEVSDTLDRQGLYLAQTPQGFVVSEIREAHEKAATQGLHDFSDDAGVVEWAGLKVLVVEGSRDNFKITTQQDLACARQKTSMTTDARTGNGYDVHQLVPGKSIILCGIKIPHDKSLAGHSDADCGLHALTDALLGTIGEGDIGTHFPPSDNKWKDVSSDQFLAHAVNLVRNAGGTITNLDVTLICEAPRIGPYRDKMRARIAEICSISLNRVSVKATTNERMGFIGREEGIAAMATASAVFDGSSQENAHE